MKTNIPHFVLLICALILLSACEKDSDNIEPTPMEEGLYFPPINGANWASTSPDSLGWDGSKIPDLLQFLEGTNTRAFIVLKDGKIVIEQYFGKDLLNVRDFTAETNWYWASAGKTLTAFTVGLAQEDGFLNIQDKSFDYLGQNWADITLDQQNAISIWNHLTMTTGLDDSRNKDCTDPECLIYLTDPGTRWSYHNAPYTILDQVVEGATQQTFDDYFHNRLTKRIGMDGFWRYLDYNHVYFSTARSMARFGLLNLNRGKWNEDVILSDEQYFAAMVNTSQDINPSYGYLWWLNGKSSYMLPGLQLSIPGSISPAAPSDLFSGIGKNGQIVSVVPGQNLVVVRMGDNPDQSLVPTAFVDDLWEKLSVIIR